MKINFYFRSPLSGYSIGSVFDTISKYFAKDFIVAKTYLPSPYANVISLLKNGFFAKKMEKRGYINHITGDVHYLLYFLHRKRTIVTVHDIMYYHNLTGIKKRIWNLLYIQPLTRAAFVTFISDFAYQQVSNILSLDKDKVRIIPNPVDDSFVYSPKVFNSVKPLILHIGTLERKNLDKTILALKGISCHLSIIGKLSAEQRKILQDNQIEYSNKYNLTNYQLKEEYLRADIVNFPSLCEGFGMPIIEAQAVGRVVVTSNLSPMKEVAGEGAFLVDPYSVDSIRNAYIKITNDKDLSVSLVRKGLENVERYKINRIAKEYIKIYQQLNESNKNNF